MRHLFYHISIIKRRKIQRKSKTKNDRYVKPVASNLRIGNCLSLLPTQIMQRGKREKKENKTKGEKEEKV